MPNDENLSAPWRRHHVLLLAIREEWDRAEGDIKRAEQINDAICLPAIKELRYSGRRIVDAIAEISIGDIGQQAESYINDARLGCYRARHDAVDAGIAKIAAEIDIAFKIFGHDVVVQCYPDFYRLFELMQYAKAEIARSRDDRTQRLTIYSALSNDLFPEMVEKYNTFQISATLIGGVTKKKRWSEFCNSLFGYGGMILAFIGIGLSFLFWLRP